MSIRSADATIKGYYYQFNKTIDSVLDLVDENDSIVIEGIEDVDINTLSGTNCVQCKYYSATTLTSSAIREPIMLMIDYYVKTRAIRNDLKFTLFGYYKDDMKCSPTFGQRSCSHKRERVVKRTKAVKAFFLFTGNLQAALLYKVKGVS